MTIRAPGRLFGILVVCAALALFGGAAFGQSARHPYNIPSEDTGDALNAFAHQSGLRILFPYAAVAGRRSLPVTGTMSEQAALDRLLAGTGLAVVSRSENVLTLGPALAPDIQAPPAPPVEVQEVVVTAEKRVELLKDVPMSMSVISGDTLTDTEADTLQDVADRTPGVQLITSSPITNELVIRGLSAGAGVNASVATYVDETPYSTVGPFAYSTNLAPNFDTYDLARVEILRGPQGTLYGANALGGLLKYVTAPPDLSRYSASLLAGVSAVDHSDQTGWDIHGMVNLPLGENAALRIVGDDQYFPGFIDDPSRGATDINGVRRYGGRASLLWRPSQDVSVRLSADVQHIIAGDTGAEDLATTLKPLYGDLVQVRAVAEPEHLTNAIYNATIDWNAGFATLLSSTSFSQVNPYTGGDLSWVYHSALDKMFGGNLGAAVVAIEPVQSFTQELRLSSPKDQTLEWIVGVFFDAEAADEHEPLFPVDLDTGQILYNFTPNLGAYHITSTYREYAGFGDLTYHVTPAFELSLGGRYSANSQTYHQVNDGVFTGIDDFSTDSRQSVFTYSADAKYRFSPRTMAYVRIASGFVPGGPNDVLPGSPLPMTYRSSSTTNYEVGIKGRSNHGRITYDLDVFDIEWQDIQLIAQVDNLYGATNGGAARSRGVEGSVSFTPARGLTLGLDGAYIDARLTRNTPASFGGVAGDRLPLSPYLSGTASAAYERPLSPDLSGFAGADWRYDGDRMSEFEFGAPRQQLPAYSMINLRLGLKFRAYSLTAYVKNAADARAISSVAPETTLGGVNILSAFIATPRTVGVTLAAKF